MKLSFKKFKKTNIPPQAIMYFRGEYAFLSNMWPCVVTLPAEHGLPEFKCNSTENMYMAWKTLDPDLRAKLATLPSAKAAKALTREEGFPTRQDMTPSARRAIMLNANRQKYSDFNPGPKAWLLDTGNAPLYEGNTWGDRFWGIDLIGGTGGQNHLGRILMQIRHELQNS